MTMPSVMRARLPTDREKRQWDAGLLVAPSIPDFALQNLTLENLTNYTYQSIVATPEVVSLFLWNSIPILAALLAVILEVSFLVQRRLATLQPRRQL